MKNKKLWLELSEFGYTGSGESFERAMVEVYGAFRDRGTSIDDLLCHQDIGSRFCDEVRAQITFDGLPNHFIIRRLLNMRKAKRLRGITSAGDAD